MPDRLPGPPGLSAADRARLVRGIIDHDVLGLGAAEATVSGTVGPEHRLVTSLQLPVTALLQAGDQVRHCTAAAAAVAATAAAVAAAADAATATAATVAAAAAAVAVAAVATAAAVAAVATAAAARAVALSVAQHFMQLPHMEHCMFQNVRFFEL